MVRDEELLLAVLNSAPIDDGVRTEGLRGTTGRDLVAPFGGSGTGEELATLRRVRDLLQAQIRDGAEVHRELGAVMGEAVLKPDVTPEGITWELRTPADERLAARVVMAWSDVTRELPGRLRACANTECNLFLIDHSRPGTARWCSMATCGNRMKARSHAQRQRAASSR